jgi:hypothetical protein
LLINTILALSIQMVQSTSVPESPSSVSEIRRRATRYEVSSQLAE